MMQGCRVGLEWGAASAGVKDEAGRGLAWREAGSIPLMYKVGGCRSLAGQNLFEFNVDVLPH